MINVVLISKKKILVEAIEHGKSLLDEKGIELTRCKFYGRYFNRLFNELEHLDVVVLADITNREQMFDCIAKVREKFKNCKVIVSIDTPAIVPLFYKQLLDLAVEAIVLQSDGIIKLIKIIEKVHYGDNYLDSSLQRLFNTSNFEVLDQQYINLLIALCKGDGYKMIASELGISLKTLYTRRVKLLEKLNVCNDRTLIGAALLLGYITKEDIFDKM